MAVRPQLYGAREVSRLGVGRLRDQRDGVLETGVGSVRQDGLDHPGRLLEDRRAGRVEDHSPWPDRVERAAQQRLLQRHEGAEVVARTPPAALRPPAQRTQPGARCIHEHPVESALGPRGPGAVTDDDVTDGRSQGTRDQLRAVRQALVGQQPGTLLSREGGEQGRLPARAGTQVQPSFVRALDGRTGQRECDQL